MNAINNSFKCEQLFCNNIKLYNHMAGLQNADFGLRTTELNYSVDIDQE